MTPKLSPSSPGPTWGELSSSIYRSHFSTQRSAKTSKSILDQADYWFTKDRNASSISRLTLREFVEFLRSQKDSEASIRRKVGVVMKVLREAYRDEKILAVPMAPLLPPAAPGRLRWLSDTEEAELLRSTSGDFISLVIILIDTGLRLGEALDLDWRDIDLEDRTLTVGRSKNGTRRTVPLTGRALSVFHPRTTGGPGGPFEGLNTWTVHRAWNTAREAMGLTDDPEFVPHCLRHTFASRLVQRGASLQSVQALLGHKRIEHTLIYAHLAPAQFRAAIDLLENHK